MMHMTFYWSTKLTLLFDWWKTESWPGYYLTLLVCFLFASFFQYLEDQRLRLLALSTTHQSQPSNNTNNNNNIRTPFLTNRVGVGSRWTNPVRVGLAVLFGVNSAIGYMLMLAVMSYNGGVLVAVVLGMSVGYFVFRAKEYEALVVDQTCAC